VQGTVTDGVLQFKGIPYATPPTGELRWQPPRPASPWSGILKASNYKSACPQASRYGYTEASYDEDCLYVNVAVPLPFAAGTAKLRPVLVWIHGGAFIGGASSYYRLDGLAKSGDLVVVSLNYRLGVFGFMAHPSFPADYNAGYGLEDQRAALRWVKRNIAAFGGDPNNVTIAGESAGAASVCMHLMAPDETAGLFQKAVIQSAGCATPLHTVAENSAIGEKVAEYAGCSDASTALSCMRTKSVKDLLDAGTKAAGDKLLAFAPSVGSKTVPLHGAEALASGKFVHVPILMGGNRDELRLYVAYAMQAGDTVTQANYSDHIKAVYGDKANRVVEKYPASAYSSPAAALGTAQSDFREDVGLNNCIYLQTAKLAREHVKVYEYVFADRDAPPVTKNPGFEMGAVHAAELPYFFPYYSDNSKVDAAALAAPEQELANQMMAYWTSFVRNGAPAVPGAPDWQSFRSDDKVMLFEPGRSGYFNATEKHQCGFWKELYPTILTK